MSDHDPLFDSAWLKFGWSIVHAQALQSDIAIHTGPDPAFSLATPKYDPKLHAFVVSVATMTPIPPTWGLHLGDFVACTRAALDHLAWALVASGKTPNLSERKLRLIYFPISDTRGDFNDSLRQRLPGVRRADIAIVRRHQPYITGNRKARWHCLATLRELSNDDKHRQIQPVWSVPESATHRVTCHDCELTMNGNRNKRARRRVIQVGAELSRIYVRKTGPNPEIDVEGNLLTKPAINEHLWLEDWLNTTSHFVDRLLTEFSTPPQELFALGVQEQR